MRCAAEPRVGHHRRAQAPQRPDPYPYRTGASHPAPGRHAGGCKKCTPPCVDTFLRLDCVKRVRKGVGGLDVRERSELPQYQTYQHSPLCRVSACSDAGPLANERWCGWLARRWGWWACQMWARAACSTCLPNKRSLLRTTPSVSHTASLRVTPDPPGRGRVSMPLARSTKGWS